jgi:exosortase
MMEFTADFTIILINLVGIPMYRDGLFFTLPSDNWSVVVECIDELYLNASLSLGTIYAYLNYHSMLKRLVFIGFAIVSTLNTYIGKSSMLTIKSFYADKMR